MDIEKLAAEKIALEQNLQAYLQMNVYGAETKTRVQQEVNRINMQKRLYQINHEIDAFIKSDLPIVEQTNE